MKSIEYYTGKDFDPSCGQALTAKQWLLCKINAAEVLLKSLTSIPFMNRDGVRIRRISLAIKDWQTQLDEIDGIEKDIQ